MGHEYLQIWALLGNLVPMATKGWLCVYKNKGKKEEGRERRREGGKEGRRKAMNGWMDG